MSRRRLPNKLGANLTSYYAFELEPALGEGRLDFAKLLDTFAKSGYAGAFSVEIEGRLGVKPHLEHVNEAMRRSRELLAKLGLG